MEIISTSNLVSSETEKLTTAFDSSFHNARTVKKHSENHISKTAKSKPTSKKVKGKVLFSSKFHYLLRITGPQQQNVDQAFLVKQQSILVKNWQGREGLEKVLWRSFLINAMIHKHKNSKKIIFCDTNTVILLTIVTKYKSQKSQNLVSGYL